MFGSTQIKFDLVLQIVHQNISFESYEEVVTFVAKVVKYPSKISLLLDSILSEVFKYNR